jgi:hypothetical protein
MTPPNPEPTMAQFHFYEKNDDGSVDDMGNWNWPSLNEGLAFFDADDECRRTRAPITWWGRIGVATEDLKHTPYAAPAPRTVQDLHRRPYPPIIDLVALDHERRRLEKKEYFEGQRALSGELRWA